MAHVFFMEGHRKKINIFLCIESYLEVTGLHLSRCWCFCRGQMAAGFDSYLGYLKLLNISVWWSTEYFYLQQCSMILYAVNKDFNFGSINSFQFLSVNPPHFSSKTIRGQFNTAVSSRNVLKIIGRKVTEKLWMVNIICVFFILVLKLSMSAQTWSKISPTCLGEKVV